MKAQRKLRFTEARIKSIKPPEAGRVVFQDSEIAGLQLRVSSSGVRSFSLLSWSPTLNKPLRVSLGKWPARTAEEVRKIAKQRLAEIAGGKDPTVRKRITREELTVGDAVDSYLNKVTLAERKHGTLALYNHLDTNFLKQWHSRRLSSLTTEQILSLRSRARNANGENTKKREGTRPEETDRKATANRLVRFLSQVFNHAIYSKWKGENPCLAITPFPEQASTRRLEDHEVGPFIEACKHLSLHGDQIGDYLLVCLFSGIRRRNVASAKWEQIDLASRSWSVPETKNGSPVTVFLSKQLTEILTRRYKGRAFSPYVFPAPSRSGHLENPEKGLLRAVRASGITAKGVTIHALKHTFISFAYESGLTPIVVSRLGGHRVHGVTARYGHTSDSKIREAYQKVADHIDAVAVQNRTRSLCHRLLNWLKI